MSPEQKKYALDRIDEIYEQKYNEVIDKYLPDRVGALRQNSLLALDRHRLLLKDLVEMGRMNCMPELLNTFRKEDF